MSPAITRADIVFILLLVRMFHICNIYPEYFFSSKNNIHQPTLNEQAKKVSTDDLETPQTHIADK